MTLNAKVIAVPMLVAFMVLLSGCSATPGKVSVKKPIAATNINDGFAVHGYDPVAYFDGGQPVGGNNSYTYEWSGARWRFASAAHRELFAQNPELYAPQFGGYCAFAVSRGTVADGDPHQWAVVDNKLYLNNNAFAMQLWNKDRPGNIEAGDTNWPLIPKK